MIITYETFLAQAQPADVQALNFLAMNQSVKTQDPVEADAMQAQGQRLFDAGLLTRLTRSLDRASDGTVWHVFEGRVDPVGATYVARAASERLTLSRLPIPTP